MRILRNFFVWFFLFLVIVNGGLFFSTYTNLYGSGNTDVDSPLPDIFGSVLGKQASASEFWQPHIPKNIVTSKLELSAKSAISYELTTNSLLYAKDVDQRRPMASLTKIMTAIVALETMDIEQKLTVTKTAAAIGESSMGLSEGEQLSLRELLYGLVLHSGNDAAETISQQSPYGKEGYVYLMNKKAEDLGLTDTRFTNPSGLQGDGDQYSTVKDLLVITKYALQNEEFAKIARTYQHAIPASPTNKEFSLFNETNLLTTYTGVRGVKTGYTDEAGMCLVTYLEYQGKKIIAVILNSENRRQEMKDLLDYSLLQLGVTPPSHN